VEAVEPIIYYLVWTPEPVRPALLEGWPHGGNQAFEAIGYKDAFQLNVA